MREPETAPLRLSVRKTYKLYVGGAFPRSESARSYPVSDVSGAHLANVAQASRKDVRDAVVAARAAVAGWSARTGYNRGQILYRVAEMMEGRREQFTAEVAAATGESPEEAADTVSAAIDRWVHYAGWADKLTQVLGNPNEVAGPYYNQSAPEPVGVVGVVAPPEAPLLGLVSVLAPVITAGNTCVVVASERAPLPAVTLAEVLATSDLPGGVVNVVTGRTSELLSPLASHADIDALDLTGADAGTREEVVELERAAASTLTRVLRPGATAQDWRSAPGVARIRRFVEVKTVWHPIGV